MGDEKPPCRGAFLIGNRTCKRDAAPPGGRTGDVSCRGSSIAFCNSAGATACVMQHLYRWAEIDRTYHCVMAVLCVPARARRIARSEFSTQEFDEDIVPGSRG